LSEAYSLPASPTMGLLTNDIDTYNVVDRQPQETADIRIKDIELSIYLTYLFNLKVLNFKTF
jgi:hypothetical protein